MTLGGITRGAAMTEETPDLKALAVLLEITSKDRKCPLRTRRIR